MNQVYILSGKIQTGKTTRLMQWAATQKKIDGVLQPIIENKRFIYHISSRTLKQLEIDKTLDQEEVIQIGKYNFSTKVFDWANKALLDAFNKNLDWLIVDEIGPLELEGKGLEPAVSKILSERDNFGGKIVCVVRDTILEKFISKYELKNHYEIFNVGLSQK